jgi:hypothetical protein
MREIALTQGAASQAIMPVVFTGLMDVEEGSDGEPRRGAGPTAQPDSQTSEVYLDVSVREERGTLEDVVEPFLIQQGFLMRSARGRLATRLAYQHLGLRVPERIAVPPEGQDA